MGVTCSLLGHAFEDAEVERERTEQGSEAVTIVREVEECRRCGERLVTSESKEVTAIVDPDDVPGTSDEQPPSDDAEMVSESADDTTSDDLTPDSDVDTSDVSVGPGGDEPPVDSDPSAEDTELVTTAESDEEESLGLESDTERDPETEDAEILDSDDDSEPEPEETREPGQWPQESKNTFTESASTDTETDEPAEETAEETETPIRPAAGGLPDGEYVCPECGFSEPVDSSSLRDGDACPDCQQGYLDAR